MLKRTSQRAGGRSTVVKLTAVLLAFLLCVSYAPRVQADEVVNSEQVVQPTTATTSSEVVAPEVAEGTENTEDTKTAESIDEAKETNTESQTQSAMSQQGDPSSPSVASTVQQKLPNVDENSGALMYQYPITVPLGRNGLQPSIALTYNSQNADDSSIFGHGWSLDIPYIERINKKGTDKLYTENYFSSSLDSELQSLGSGAYGAIVENGDFRTYALNSNVWTVKDKLGNTYTFGGGAASRQDDPNDSTKVARWMLQEVRDPNNNYISYEYYKDAGQIYPSVITYTGNGSTDGIFTINFSRQSRGDNLKSYKTAFLVTTNYRISEISTAISGSWVRKYVLGYSAGDNGLRSMLASITESGRDESGTSTTLPATSFTYQTSTPGWDEDTTTFAAPDQMTAYRNLVDLNGDAMVDIIKSYKNTDYTLQQSTWLNTGNYNWSLQSSLQAPLLFQGMEIRGGAYGGVWDLGGRVADVNGDQFPDIVVGLDVAPGFNGSTYTAYLNNAGSGWTQDNSWAPTIGFAETSGDDPYHSGGSIQDYGARVSDLNADGLTDIIRQSGGDYRGVQLNTGSSFGTSTSAWDLAINTTAPNTQLADVNNDGLPDIIYYWRDISYQINYRYAYLNNGTGSWTNDANLVSPIDFTGPDDLGVRFVDVNGDGIVDTVADSNNSNRHTRLGKGNSWGPDASNWDMPFASNGFSGGETHVGDFDYDGLVDFIYSYTHSGNSVSTKVWKHRGVEPDLLSRVSYAQGGYTDVTYQKSAKYKDSSGNILNPNLPFNLTTVKSVTNNDGNGLTAAYTYCYEGGKYFYNGPFDRKLSGFAKIKRTDSANTATTTYYHQGDTTNSSQGEYSDEKWKIGKPYRVEIVDASGNVYQKTINKWESYDLGNGRKFVKLVQNLAMTYDGDSDHRDTATTYAYDDSTGKLTQRVDWGEVTGADAGTFTDTGSDKLTTDIAYAVNSGSTIYLPKTETVTDQSSNKLRESKYYYDNQAHGTVTVGNQTKVESWKSGSAYVTTQKTYNTTYGLVSTETDARGKTTSYTYDSYYLYPATVTNPLSQVVSYTYDYSLGKPKQVTDPNTRVFQTVYDGLDRVVEEKQPDQTTPSTLVTKTTYTYTPQSVGNKIQRTDYLDGSTTVDTYTYTDGFDREIQTRREMEDSNTFAVTDKVYNTVEQLYKESAPYASTGSSKTSPTTTTSLLTTYTYDPVLRVVSAQNAVGTVTTSYDDWKQTVTDARGKNKDLYTDAHGNLVRVDEHNGASTYSTYYEYNGNKNLTKITDALSNVRNFTYDGLGRRLTAQDLHASSDTSFGTWTYVYDDAGNLTQTVDAKGQTVNYTYDDRNRKLTENYTGQSGTEVQFTYDTCTNGVGRLCESEVVGTTLSTYKYTPTGELSEEYENTNGSGFTTTYTYDRQGNQLEITNPDSSKVKYTYNTAGQLETVQRKESTDGSFVNVVTDFDYGPHGSVTVQTNQNGTVTTNTYDATKLYRLSSKVTTSGSTDLQNLAYTYDANGNITQLVDASDTNSAKTVDYTYDDLNRLLSATTSSPASGQSNYTQTFTYDAIGNMLTGPTGSYSYAGNTGGSLANPHAATTVGSTGYDYDENGSLVGKSYSTAPSWYSTGGTWTTRKQVTIDHTKVAGSASLSNFTVLVSLTDADLKTTANGGHVGKSDGTDILFTESNGTTKLSHEIEKYDGATGTLVAWVKVPTLSNSTDTKLVLYYGNSSASDQQDVANAWDTSYKGVWHLQNSFADSTSNDNDGTNANTTDGSGKISQGRSMDGDGDRITMANTSSLKPTSGITVSMWLKRSTATQKWGAKPLWFGSNSSSPWGAYGFQFANQNSGQLSFHLADDTNGHDLYSSTNLANGTWYHVVGTFNGTSNKLYVNGTEEASDSTTFTLGNYDGSNGLGVGDKYQQGNEFAGDMDEVRVSNTAKSADWIATEYNNQNSPSTFLSLGSVSGGSVYDSYNYNFKNQLYQTNTGAYFGYDASGQRVRATLSGTTTLYPTQHYNTDGTTAQKHILTPNGTTLATVKGTGSSAAIYYTHTDHLTGSSIVSTSTGTQEQLLDYYPYGEARINQQAGTFNEQKKFTGYLRDDATGLDYAGARYYNPSIGRFVAQDAIFQNVGGEVQNDWLVNPQLQNSYSYSQNNPLIYIDKDGNFPVLAAMLIGALVGSVTSYFAQPSIANAPAVGAPTNTGPSTTAMLLNGALSTYVGGVTFGAGAVEYNAAQAYNKDLAKALQGGVAASSSNAKAATLQLNKAKGEAFEAQVFSETKNVLPKAQQQVTLLTKDGTRTKLDIVSPTGSGGYCLIECKSSSTAPLTKNQVAAFPSIAKYGAVVVGNGKPGIPGGTVIGPTKVQIIRPSN